MSSISQASLIYIAGISQAHIRYISGISRQNSGFVRSGCCLPIILGLTELLGLVGISWPGWDFMAWLGFLGLAGTSWPG